MAFKRPCPDCPDVSDRGACASCGLTQVGRRLVARRASMRSFGIPQRAVKVSFDLEHGLASLTLPVKVRGTARYSRTIPDLVPGVNVDVSEDGSIIGLEDVSADLSLVVARWFEALEAAKAKLAATKKSLRRRR